MKRKVWIWVAIVLVMVAGISVLISGNDRFSMFKESQGTVLNSSQEIKADNSISGALSSWKDYLMSLDDEYEYYLNEKGQPEFILLKDDYVESAPKEERDDFGKKEAQKIAEEWFSRVFYMEVQGENRELESVTADFDGGSYTTTVRLMENGVDTGYSASISVMPDGRMMASTFIAGDSEKKDVKITKEEAILLAREAVLKECRELYGDEVQILWEKAKKETAQYRVFKGLHFWEVEFLGPVSGFGPWEGFDFFYSARIEASTGKSFQIATNMK